LRREWNNQIKLTLALADGNLRMLWTPPPMTNAERQREFQQRHPGYDRRRKARLRDMVRRQAAKQRAELLAQAELARTASAAAAAEVMKLVCPIPLIQLALPAPVENPLLVEINNLAAMVGRTRERVEVAR
jgi:hypothetical protein